MGNVKQQLAKLFEVALKSTVPNEPDVDPLIAICTAKFGDYQWYDTCFGVKALHDLWLWDLPRKP